MVHFTGLLENARHPVGGLLSLEPLSLDFCKNRVRAGIGGWPGTATGGQIHVVHISHTHPPKEIIQALRKYLLGKNQFFIDDFINQSTRYFYVRIGKRMFENSFLPSSSHPQDVLGRRLTFVTIKITRYRKN